MSTYAGRLIRWVPRAAGILLAAFLGIFALDSFGPDVPLTQAIPAFLIHLVPTYLVLGVVAVAWRFEWVGSLAFLALAVAYGVMVHWRMDWVAVISGPLLVVAALFFWSWRHHGALHAPR